MINKLLAFFILCVSLNAATIEVIVPPNHEHEPISSIVQGDVDSEINKETIQRHIKLFSELGWVKEVDVKIPQLDNGDYKICYTLIPRAKIKEIRFEGNTKFSDSELRNSISSRVGQTFNLRRALFSDALLIVDTYLDKHVYDLHKLVDEDHPFLSLLEDHPLFSVLSSEDVVFKDGVLTFKIKETNEQETQ